MKYKRDVVKRVVRHYRGVCPECQMLINLIKIDKNSWSSCHCGYVFTITKKEMSNESN